MSHWQNITAVFMLIFLILAVCWMFLQQMPNAIFALVFACFFVLLSIRDCVREVKE